MTNVTLCMTALLSRAVTKCEIFQICTTQENMSNLFTMCTISKYVKYAVEGQLHKPAEPGLLLLVHHPQNSMCNQSQA